METVCHSVVSKCPQRPFRQIMHGVQFRIPETFLSPQEIIISHCNYKICISKPQIFWHFFHLSIIK